MVQHMLVTTFRHSSVLVDVVGVLHTAQVLHKLLAPFCLIALHFGAYSDQTVGLYKLYVLLLDPFTSTTGIDARKNMQQKRTRQ